MTDPIAVARARLGARHRTRPEREPAQAPARRSRRRCAATRGMWGEDEEAWGFVALVHDFDYEKYPDRENHPFRGVEILKALGYPEWVTRAILSHADYCGVPRESRLEKTLFACDELAGFITAAALVRPSKSVLDLEASSVIKRMKDKAFARAVRARISGWRADR